MRETTPAFRAFRLRGSNEVYAYEEKHSSARVICKFYGPRFGWDRDRAASTAHREYESLQRLRGYDLVGSPHHVIRPLGIDRDLNCVLALEFYAGEQFSHTIARSIHQRDGAHLFWRLKALAYFLADPAQPDRKRAYGRFRHRLPLFRATCRPTAAQTPRRSMGCR